MIGGTAAFAVPPKMSSRAPLDHLSLYQAFVDCFSLAAQTLEWPSQNQPKLVEEYPAQREGEFDTSFDIILMSLAGSHVSSTSNRRDQRPKGIEEVSRIPYPGLTGYLQVRSKWEEDVQVRFDVLSKSNRKANELAMWWHRTLVVYAQSLKFFMARGVNDFRFAERLADQTTKEYGQTLYCRPLLYTLRLELDILTKCKTLDQINMRLGSSKIEIDG